MSVGEKLRLRNQRAGGQIARRSPPKHNTLNELFHAVAVYSWGRWNHGGMLSGWHQTEQPRHFANRRLKFLRPSTDIIIVLV